MHEMENYFEPDFDDDEMDEPADFNPEFFNLNENPILAQQLAEDEHYWENENIDLTPLRELGIEPEISVSLEEDAYVSNDDPA